MPVEWSCSASVDASPERVYAWMTDFTSDDHGSEAFRRGAGLKPGKKAPESKRSVVSRDGNVLVIEDQWGRSKFRLTAMLVPEKREVLLDGSFAYHAVWRAAPEGEGTRLTVDGRMGKGLMGKLLKPFMQKRMQAQMTQDFNGHVEELRESLALVAKR